MGEIFWNGLRLTLEENDVAVNGQKVAMPKMERKLLLFFLEHPDTPLSRDRLLKEVWDYGVPGETRTVDTHVKKLRAHLGQAGASIQTVRGVGYRLEGQPECLCCKKCA